MPQDLGDEERIAVGFLRQRVAERDAFGVHVVPGDRFHQREQVDVVETLHREPFDSGLSVPRDERVGQGMVGSDLRVPERRDDEEPRRIGRGHDVAEQ